MHIFPILSPSLLSISLQSFSISEGLSPLTSPGIFQDQVAKANLRAYQEVSKAKHIGNGDIQMGKKSIEMCKIDEKRHNVELLLAEVDIQAFFQQNQFLFLESDLLAEKRLEKGKSDVNQNGIDLPLPKFKPRITVSKRLSWQWGEVSVVRVRKRAACSGG